MKLFAQLALAAVIALPAFAALAEGADTTAPAADAPATETKTVDKTEHKAKHGKHMTKHTKKTETKKEDGAASTDDSKM